MRRALALAAALRWRWPAVASAHATLEGTTPARGAQAAAPRRRVVQFRFDEPVEATFGALHVFDARGHEVQTGAAFHPGGRGNVVAVRAQARPGRRRYTATYRVVSADGHIVSSGFVFNVGTATGPSESVTSCSPAPTAGRSPRPRRPWPAASSTARSRSAWAR